jgi:hypothetical protein
MGRLIALLMDRKGGEGNSGGKLSNRVIFSVLVIILPLLYFYPAIFGKLSLVQGDGWAANLGIRILTGNLLSRGILPLWNPYLFGGMPHLASVYPGVLYPPNWVFAFLRPQVAMNVVVITTFHWALAGTYRYARSLELSRLSSLLAGVVFTFGGYMVMSMGQTSNIAAAAWLPWVLLAIEKLYQRPRWIWVALGSLFAALQVFAGVPQISWYTALVAGAYFIFNALFRPDKENRRRFIPAGIAMAVLGAMLSAIQLLPLRELQQQGSRANISYEYFAAFSFPPWQLPSFVFPYFFGGASLGPYSVPYWGESGIFVTCGYVGLFSLLLVSVAGFTIRRQPLFLFWCGTAVISLFLAFGDHLPFRLNHLLHHLPVYNLFRASFRHMFEFTFAIAILAGMGMNFLSQAPRKEILPPVRGSIILGTVLVLLTLFTYRSSGQMLSPLTLRPPGSNSLANPEVLVPLGLFAVTAVLLGSYVRRRSKRGAVLLLLVLLADLTAYGHYLEWRSYNFSIAKKLADPPALRYIKQREPDLQSFRILSYSRQPFGENYEGLDYPNNSIDRGVQSVNGNDMLRLQRVAEVLGQMTPEGVVQDFGAFGLTHTGFDLLNVKYLLFERRNMLDDANSVLLAGVRFAAKPLEAQLRPGQNFEVSPGGVLATEIAIVSTMSNSAQLPDQEPVVKVILYTKEGHSIEREMLLGRDTSEWAYDRSDVRRLIQHARAPVAESWTVSDPSGEFQAHRYLSRLSFERSDIVKVEFQYLRKDAEIMLMRASLLDGSAGPAYSLEPVRLPPERWQKLAAFGAVDLYENLHAQPRAWFVERIEWVEEAEALKAIRDGVDRQGSRFHPDATALIRAEGQQQPRPNTGRSPGALVRFQSPSPNRVSIETTNELPGLLVISEIDYPGWEARIDGVRSDIYRVDYTLRGVWVPAGRHTVEMIYAPRSFRLGAISSAIALLLIVGAGAGMRLRAKGTRATGGSLDR